MMARIRSVKPEFWTSEQVMECSVTARLLFIGMWNFCDDQGVHPASAKKLKAEIFPGDDISLDGINALVSELSVNGLVQVYRVENTEYIKVLGWHHQKINRPQAPKYPPPPEGGNGAFTERSPLIGKDRIGEDRKGDGAPDGATSYAFEGNTIRLKQADFDRWKTSFPNIDLRAALQNRDDWYAEHPPQDGKWFIPTSNWLKAENLRAKGESPPEIDYDAIEARLRAEGRL